MTRINEKEAAEEFVAKLTQGYYPYDRSVNTEVNYREEKEQRDTNAVKTFLQSDLFSHIKNLA